MNQAQSKFVPLLVNLSQTQFTGKIIVQLDTNTVWYIYLCLGRLVWTDGGVHPNRSWKRLIERYCSSVNWKELKPENLDEFECINYCILTFLLQNKLIDRETAIEVIKTKATENLFDILQLEAKQTLKIIEPEATSASSFLVSASTRSISLVNIEDILNEALQHWLNWQQIGLQDWSPNLAPGIQNADKLQEKVAEVVYQNFIKLLNGQSTLRDLSYRMNKDVDKLTSSLIPYVSQEMLELLEVQDINSVQYAIKAFTSEIASVSTAPVIACVDDSPQICKIMEQIITKHGYRFVGIQESLQAVPTLIKVNPELIFLDIGMPLINGYEICSQVRRISKLKNVPIVFLTGNDGIVDRMRAKVVGASDFLSKPIEISKIHNIILKYSALDMAKNSN